MIGLCTVLLYVKRMFKGCSLDSGTQKEITSKLDKIWPMYYLGRIQGSLGRGHHCFLDKPMTELGPSLDRMAIEGQKFLESPVERPGETYSCFNLVAF